MLNKGASNTPRLIESVKKCPVKLTRLLIFILLTTFTCSDFPVDTIGDNMNENSAESEKNIDQDKLHYYKKYKIVPNNTPIEKKQKKKIEPAEKSVGDQIEDQIGDPVEEPTEKPDEDEMPYRPKGRVVLV